MCLETELISTRDYYFVPGRLRVTVPIIKGNQEKADFMAHGLNHIPDISGYINPTTGRLLLTYDV